MFLAALPERIQRALLAHSRETQHPLEMVLEMAIAGFLSSEAITSAAGGNSASVFDGEAVGNSNQLCRCQTGAKNCGEGVSGQGGCGVMAAAVSSRCH